MVFSQSGIRQLLRNQGGGEGSERDLLAIAADVQRDINQQRDARDEEFGAQLRGCGREPIGAMA